MNVGAGIVFPCALGRGGISALKREGDGATPLAAMRLLSGYVRGSSFRLLSARAAAALDHQRPRLVRGPRRSQL
jgi:L,D-peptidoglycan transpeptidase YkuD (ErfK/YbiS/YcfS/YnhG family)